MFIIRRYSLGSIPASASTDAMAMHRLFQKQGILRVESIPDLVYLLFEDIRFVRYAALGTEEGDEGDLPVTAFEIILKEYPEGMLQTDEYGSILIKDAALQLIFNEQNPNPIPDHAYTMAYPETSISKSGDIVILYDAEKARSTFEAWVAGIPFVDDLETKTYLLNEENGKYELQPNFDDSMA